MLSPPGLDMVSPGAGCVSWKKEACVLRSNRNIVIFGAGILGLWQALLFARSGHQVRVIEKSRRPFSDAASQYAGAMIAPFCEAESAEAVVRELGFEAAAIWRQLVPGLIENGSLVVAGARDQNELKRFARLTEGHETIGAASIAELEPDLADRFHAALYFEHEAHMITPTTMQAILQLAMDAGASFDFGEDASVSSVARAKLNADIIVDCRGLGAREELPDLRGVRGERILVRTRELNLSRPVRLLHPRYPFYAVPWDNGRVLIGATLIESEDTTPMTVRSALELLGMAYALHPAFGEAEILEMSAGVRPSFSDNIPRVIVRDNGRHLFVNGAYRHGFLLAPMLARVTHDFVAGTVQTHPLLLKQ